MENTRTWVGTRSRRGHFVDRKSRVAEPLGATPKVCPRCATKLIVSRCNGKHTDLGWYKVQARSLRRSEVKSRRTLGSNAKGVPPVCYETNCFTLQWKTHRLGLVQGPGAVTS